MLLQKSADRWHGRRPRSKGPFRARRWVVADAQIASRIGIESAALPIMAGGLQAGSACNPWSTHASTANRPRCGTRPGALSDGRQRMRPAGDHGSLPRESAGLFRARIARLLSTSSPSRPAERPRCTSQDTLTPAWPLPLAGSQAGFFEAARSIVAANGLPHQNRHPSRRRSTFDAPSVRKASA